MVQFNLPQNSKILKGQYFKDKTGSSNLKIVHIYRWDPEKNENPREDTFEVNLDTLQQQKTKFPEGTIKGKLKNAIIRISGGTALLDLQLPELDLSEVQFEVQLGRSIHIKKIEFHGSLEGIIEGTIQLNEKHPQMSLIDLNIQVTPSPALKRESAVLAQC